MLSKIEICKFISKFEFCCGNDRINNSDGESTI